MSCDSPILARIRQDCSTRCAERPQPEIIADFSLTQPTPSPAGNSSSRIARIRYDARSQLREDREIARDFPATGRVEPWPSITPVFHTEHGVSALPFHWAKAIAIAGRPCENTHRRPCAISRRRAASRDGRCGCRNTIRRRRRQQGRRTPGDWLERPGHPPLQYRIRAGKPRSRPAPWPKRRRYAWPAGKSAASWPKRLQRVAPQANYRSVSFVPESESRFGVPHVFKINPANHASQRELIGRRLALYQSDPPKAPLGCGW